jgi:3-hydroxyacyl-CoA dehydrogenase
MEELTKRFQEERKCLEKKNNEIEIQLQTEKRKYEELRDNHETVIFKMEEERKTLLAELESIKAEDSLNQMRSRDLSTLASAVGSKDKDQVKLVLDELDVDINARMRHENKIEGSVLVLAVQAEDLEMLKMLVQDLGANVNQEIILDGKQSTLLIMAMAQASSR